MARKVHRCNKYITAPAVNLDRRQGSTREQKDRVRTKKPRQEVLCEAFLRASNLVSQGRFELPTFPLGGPIRA